MPLVPNLLESLLFLTFNQAPGPILDLWSGPASRMVLAAAGFGRVRRKDIFKVGSPLIMVQ